MESLQLRFRLNRSTTNTRFLKCAPHSTPKITRWFSLCCLFSLAPLGQVYAAQPDFGPNVKIFSASMPQSEIQATVDAIASQQISNQFGTQRYALLFMPGTYGNATNPLNFQVGYYTAVAGLGSSPNDVVINGSIDVRNQCLGTNNCVALINFWRSLSNLTINVTNPTFGCHTGEFWAVSQAAPMRRVHIIGFVTLMDFCTPHRSPAAASSPIRSLTAAPWSTARSSNGWSGTAISMAGPTASGTRCSRASWVRPTSVSPLRKHAAVRIPRSRPVR